MANNKSSFKILGPEIFGLLAVFAIILGVLNYFNILSLSRLYPKLFGFLPHNTSPYSQKTTVETQKLLFFCPAPVRPCDGKAVFKNNNYVGIGFKLSEKDPIVAAISGDLIYRDENATQSSVRDTAVIVGKSGQTKGYAAIYDYIGVRIGNQLVKSVLKGEVVGVASAGAYLKNPDYRGINLIFRIHDDKGKVVPLSPSNFE